jgi:HD-like signal output (HDOD) protein
LLDQVRSHSPPTNRIIMSGFVALNKRALPTSAHQYIAKPFDTIKLRETIRRCFAAQDRVKDKALRGIVTALRSIPSLPQAHHALLKELEDHRNGMANIVRLIADDAGLSVKVLQLANSPLFGQGYLIENPFDAVMCLGTDMISAIVLSQSLFRHYDSMGAKEIDPRRVWSHCWQTAYFAQHIAREMRLTRIAGEEAFLASLLHETGRFIFADNFPDQFSAACQRAQETKSPLPPCLEEAFHCGPGQIAAYVLELWGMPSGVVNSIMHLDAPAAERGAGFSLNAALYIADGIASRQTPADSFLPVEWNTPYLAAVGCEEKVPTWEKLSLGPKNTISQ